MTMIDSHAHIASPDTARYPAAPLGGHLDAGVLDDPITAERLLGLMDEAGVAKAVLVQRAHIYGYDNSYVVDAANRYPDRFRAVICIDAEAPDAPATLRGWAERGGVVGVRLVAPGLTSPVVASPELGTDWFAGGAAQACWAVAAERGLSVCIHFYRWNRVEGLAALADVARRFPAVPVVLDHAANIAGGAAEGFGVDEALRAICALPSVFQKLTMINYGRLKAAGEDLAAMTAAVESVAGAGRVMWGSDVGQSRGGFAEMVALGRAAASRLKDADAFLSGTAQRIYWGA